MARKTINIAELTASVNKMLSESGSAEHWMSEADVKKMCEAYEIDIETFDFKPEDEFDPTGIVNE